MGEREQFESVMRERGEDYLHRRDVPGCERIGEYCRQGVQDQWEIWQASRRAALEEAANIAVEKLKSLTTEMEGYSYFGSNPGVKEDDYEDVAAAIRNLSTGDTNNG
jgi:hypothetical protein